MKKEEIMREEETVSSINQKITNQIFDMQETEIPHNPYDHEQRKLSSIEKGDIGKLRNCQKEKFEGQLGRVASDDLRNAKNMAIIVITLASRAAIRGGLNPELAFTMADNYICEIENYVDERIIRKKIGEYEEEFARQVSLLKKTLHKNRYVENAKDYIYKHLHNVKMFEVYEAVRKAVGRDYPVWIKINSQDGEEGGITLEECMFVCKKLSDMGLDAAEISGGIAMSKRSASARRVSKQEDEAHFLPEALKIAENVSADVISVGGHRSPERMEEAINEGEVKAISLCRPLICEPDIVSRWASGDYAKPKCISCNKCFSPGGLSCKVFK